MRKLMLACAALALISGIVSMTLWRELRDERVRTGELQALVAEAEQRMADSRSMAASVMPARPPAAGAAAAGSKADAGEATPAPPRPPAAEFMPVTVNSAELMKDPEYRKAMLAQRRMSIPLNHPGLAEELGLTPEEADKLFDLLAENQMERSAMIRGNVEDVAAVQRMIQDQEEMQRKLEESIGSLLGDARLAQYKEYMPTQAPRMQAVQLARTMESLGRPLSDAQLKPLTAAYIAEQARQRQDAEGLARELRQGGVPDMQRLEELSFRRQQESNRRLVDAVRPHMDARQLEMLQSTLEQQLTISRATTRAMQAQRNATGAATVNSVVIMGTGAGVAPPPPQP